MPLFPAIALLNRLRYNIKFLLIGGVALLASGMLIAQIFVRVREEVGFVDSRAERVRS